MRRHRLLTGSALALAWLAAVGGPARAGVSDKLEDVLGKYVRWLVESSLPLDHDPLLAGIVEGVGNDLSAVGGRPGVEYRYRVLDIEDVNAVAGPGGYVWVTKGALRFVNSPDELAGILGHETGHVTKRHGWTAFKQDMAYLWLMLGTPLGATANVARWADNAYFVTGLKLSRDDEYEADREGCRYASEAGYDATRTTGFFERMGAERGHQMSRLEVLFATHPSETARIARIEGMIDLRDPAAMVRLGDGCMARRQFADAMDAYRKAAEDPSLSAQALTKAAAAAAMLGDGEGAASRLAAADAAPGGAGMLISSEGEAARAIVAAMGRAPETSDGPLASANEIARARSSVQAAMDRVTSARADIDEARERLDSRRGKVRQALDAAEAAARARGGPSAPGGDPASRALEPIAGFLRAARAATVATDARAEECTAILNERSGLLSDLDAALTAGRRVQSGLAALADRCAGSTAAIVDQCTEALGLSEAAAVQVQDAAEHASATPSSAGRAVPAPLRSAGTDGLLDAATDLTRRAERAAAFATLDNSLSALSLRGWLAGRSRSALEEAAAACLRLPDDITSAARAATADLGRLVLLAGVSRQTGCSVRAAAEALPPGFDVAPGLQQLGSDPDNLAIACRLAALAVREGCGPVAHEG